MFRNKVKNMHFIYFIFLSFVNILSAKNCADFEVKLEQSLSEEGFHRNLSYKIEFDFEDDLCKLKQSCFIGLDQTLPSGTYASNDELNDFRRTNKVNAIVKNKINIELPAELSYEYTVYILSMVTGNTIYMWLPIHARYHKAAPGGGTARVEIKPPRLFLTCPTSKPDPLSRVQFVCNSRSKEKCAWKEIFYTAVSDKLVWNVPIGNLDHYYVVSFITGGTISVISLYLCKALLQAKIVDLRQNRDAN